MRSSRSRFIFKRVSSLESFNNSLDRFRVWHLLKLLFKAPECNFVRTSSKILFNHIGALFQTIEFWTRVGHVSQKILYWLIIWKLVCVLIVMDHEWSRILNKLIREFLLSIFRSEALFGHPVYRCPKRRSPCPLDLFPNKCAFAPRYFLEYAGTIWISYLYQSP